MSSFFVRRFTGTKVGDLVHNTFHMDPAIISRHHVVLTSAIGIWREELGEKIKRTDFRSAYSSSEF